MKIIPIILLIFIALLNTINDQLTENNFQENQFSVTSENGEDIQVTILLDQNSSKYTDRIESCIRNSISFLESKFSKCPFNNLTVFSSDKIEDSDDLEMNSYIKIHCDFFSPIELHEPEFEISKQITALWFQKVDKKNVPIKVGIVEYIAQKIMDQYYPEKLASFSFINYYPVFGLQLLSFMEIPIIYSLGEFPIPPISEYANRYYPIKTFGNFGAAPDERIPQNIRSLSSLIKPVMALFTIERHIGEKNCIDLLNKYFFTDESSDTQSSEFIEFLKTNLSADLFTLVDEVLINSKYSDYKIRNIVENGSMNYQVFVERVGDAISPIEIAFYTETDTSILHWNGEERLKIFSRTTNSPLQACEIDPGNKNLFDINFANNSYTVDSHYWGALSLAIRSFFWFQNALMILGSFG